MIRFERIENGIKSNLAECHQRIDELKKEVVEYRQHCSYFIRRLDEVSAQKGPLLQLSTVKSSDALRAATKEIVGSVKS